MNKIVFLVAISDVQSVWVVKGRQGRWSSQSKCCWGCRWTVEIHDVDGQEEHLTIRQYSHLLTSYDFIRFYMYCNGNCNDSQTFKETIDMAPYSSSQSSMIDVILVTGPPASGRSALLTQLLQDLDGRCAAGKPSQSQPVQQQSESWCWK